MSDPGSSLVFSTGIEEIDFTVQRTIDRWRLRSVSPNYLTDQISVRLQKGFDDPDDPGTEIFLDIPGTLTIENVSEATAISYDGKSFTVPSGTHFDNWADYDPAPGGELLLETIEKATFSGIENMNVVSGTEVGP